MISTVGRVMYAHDERVKLSSILNFNYVQIKTFKLKFIIKRNIYSHVVFRIKIKLS